MRLCAALRGLLGGSKYVKQSELSREVLLSYAIQKGDVVPVTLFTVTVEPLAGGIFDVQMEEKQNSVKQLRLLIQQEQGTPRFSQALFLLPKSGKTEEASEFPMTDEKLIEGSCSVVLCVNTRPAIKWAKVGTGITISDELAIKKTESGWRLGTGSLLIGGADGVREGYFEVELTADAASGVMDFLVGIVNTASIMTRGISWLVS